MEMGNDMDYFGCFTRCYWDIDVRPPESWVHRFLTP